MARRNVALASNGGVVTVSSSQDPVNFPAAGAINGDRTNNNWNTPSGNGWQSIGAAWGGTPEWLRVDFNDSMLIDEIDVFTYGAATPTLSSTDNVSSYGLKNFIVEYYDGSWHTLGTVTNNLYVWNQFIFTPVVATAIRVSITYCYDNYARVLEFEGWGDNYVAETTGPAIIEGPASSFALVGSESIIGTGTMIGPASSIAAVGTYSPNAYAIVSPNGAVNPSVRCFRF